MTIEMAILSGIMTGSIIGWHHGMDRGFRKHVKSERKKIKTVEMGVFLIALVGFIGLVSSNWIMFAMFTFSHLSEFFLGRQRGTEIAFREVSKWEEEHAV